MNVKLNRKAGFFLLISALTGVYFGLIVGMLFMVYGSSHDRAYRLQNAIEFFPKTISRIIDKIFHLRGFYREVLKAGLEVGQVLLGSFVLSFLTVSLIRKRYEARRKNGIQEEEKDLFR